MNTADQPSLPPRSAKAKLRTSEQEDAEEPARTCPGGTPLQFRLRHRGRSRHAESPGFDFARGVEEVVQHSIREIRRNYSEAVEDLESLVFVKELTRRNLCDHAEPSLEQALFSKIVGLYEFRLHDRVFVGIEHIEKLKSSDGKDSPNLDGRLLRQLLNDSLQRTAESQRQEVKEHAKSNGAFRKRRPIALELLTVLLGHLHEMNAKTGSGDPSRAPRAGESSEIGFHLHPVHPARRAALREWHGRQEGLSRDHYDHSPENANASYTYPIVEAIPFVNGYLCLLLMSPLNTNFVDEKVTEEHRVNPLTLAIFEVGNRLSQQALDAVLPLVRQAFARVFFTQMADLNGHVSANSFEELGKISRFWVTHASDGLRGLLSEEELNRPFDPFVFCDKIVETVLCQIPEVTTEVYPFDRVLIFREVGVKDLAAGEDEGGVEQRQKEPVELLVLEASVVSNNPADRGRFLTRRERQLRDTQDYECDPSRKRIRERDRFRFYVHGYQDHLILSRRAVVDDHAKEEACQPEYRSRRSQNLADQELYYVGRIDPELFDEHDQVDTALYNLFGRVLGNAIEAKEVAPPQIPGEEPRPPYKTVALREDFRKLRQKILDRFDESGLSYHYEHGLDLQKRPLLARLLAAYNEYLADKFQQDEEGFQRETYLEDSLSFRQIDELIKLQRHKKNVERRRRRADQESSAEEDHLRRSQAKVVYASFSSRLHKENTRQRGEEDEHENSEDESNMLLGDEYAFTMMLVSDHDRDKSQARIQAERNDLKLYFQMLLRQVWMDKLNEHQYLARKSRTISECLTQFLHRFKGMLPHDAYQQRKEMDNLFDGLKKLTAYETSQLTPYEVHGAADLFNGLLRTSEILHDSEVEEVLARRASQWGLNGVQVTLLPSPLPPMRLSWSQTVASDAFEVAFKNACEAADLVPPGEKKEVRVSARALSGNFRHGGDRWYVMVLIENTGGPIPPARLKKLNSPSPRPVNRDSAKENKGGSTGVGVFVSRYQLQNVMGQGADLFFLNTSDDVVQVRMRLPAQLLEREMPEVMLVRTETPTADYALYVEDDAAQYETMKPELERVLSTLGLVVQHCRDYSSAVEAARSRRPCFVLTDLSILLKEDDADYPVMRNGLELVRNLMEIGNEDDRRFPILVLTAEGESLIREKLGTQPDQYGYRYVPAEGEDSTLGTLRILSERKSDVKDPSELLSLVRSIRFRHRQEEFPRETGPAVSFKLLSFETLVAGLEEQLPDSPEPVVVVEHRTNTLPQLTDTLRTWFQHPGIPEPHPIFRSTSERYLLTNHVYLRRLVLLVLTQGEAARTSARFRYWGLSKNLWLTSEDVSKAACADTWLRLRHEARGPLSTLRHDLMNQWDRPTLTELIQDALRHIRNCEQLLSMSDKTARKLEEFLHEKKKQGKRRRLLDIAGSDDLECEQVRVEGALNALIETLQSGRLREPSLESKLDEQIETLRRLRNYLGDKR